MECLCRHMGGMTARKCVGRNGMKFGIQLWSCKTTCVREAEVVSNNELTFFAYKVQGKCSL